MIGISSNCTKLIVEVVHLLVFLNILETQFVLVRIRMFQLLGALGKWWENFFIKEPTSSSHHQLLKKTPRVKTSKSLKEPTASLDTQETMMNHLKDALFSCTVYIEDLNVEVYCNCQTTHCILNIMCESSHPCC